MSSAEPVGEPRPSRAALAIRRAKAQPTMANVVDAISDKHDGHSSDFATIKADFATIKADFATIKADMATIKADFATIKADVGKLLHHFGLASGGTP